MSDARKNLATALVAVAPSPALSGTTLTVTAGHGARSPAAPFDVTLAPDGVLPDPANAEIARCTAVVSNTLTLTRAQYGTSAVAVVVGDRVTATITKKTLDDIDTDIAGKAATVHVHAGEDITSGTVADARIAATIARDSEVTTAISTSEAGQVRDGDAAGGVLGGTYPNPSFAVDMATQAELDAHVNDATDAHDATAVSFAPAGTIAATNVQAAIEEVASEGASLAAAVILAPASSARNVIQPTAANVIPMTVRGAVAQTADLGRWEDSAGVPLVEIAAAGTTTVSPSVGGIPDSDFLVPGAILAVPAVVDVFGDGSYLNYTGLSVQLNDKSSAEMLAYVSSVAPGKRRGQISIFDRDTSDEHIMGYASVSGYGFYIDDYDYDLGVYVTGYLTANPNRIEHQRDAGGDGERALFRSLSSPHRFWALGEQGNMILGANAFDVDGDMQASEVQVVYDDDDVAPAFLLRGKTADGSIATATIPITPA